MKRKSSARGWTYTFPKYRNSRQQSAMHLALIYADTKSKLFSKVKKMLYAINKKPESIIFRKIDHFSVFGYIRNALTKSLLTSLRVVVFCFRPPNFNPEMPHLHPNIGKKIFLFIKYGNIFCLFWNKLAWSKKIRNIVT